jgi:hypothetical protein
VSTDPNSFHFSSWLFSLSGNGGVAWLLAGALVIVLLAFAYRIATGSWRAP